MNTDKQCSNCGTDRLKPWDELDTEEREVVKRLPGARVYSLEHRQRRHLWCTRCWYESPGDEEHIA